MEIGIVGFGRFGQFAARILGRDFSVSAYDARTPEGNPDVRLGTLREVAGKPCLLLCVPMSRMERVCRRLAPLLTPGQLVMDTCSVKEEPLRLMLEILPRPVEVVGTHPLFGPETGRQGVAGLEVVLCPGRGNRVGKVKQYLETLELRVTVTTATEHDRAMARTQALFHFLAQGFSRMKVDPDTLATPRSRPTVPGVSGCQGRFQAALPRPAADEPLCPGPEKEADRQPGRTGQEPVQEAGLSGPLAEPSVPPGVQIRRISCCMGSPVTSSSSSPR